MSRLPCGNFGSREIGARILSTKVLDLRIWRYQFVAIFTLSWQVNNWQSITHFPTKRTALKEYSNCAWDQLISNELRGRATHIQMAWVYSTWIVMESNLCIYTRKESRFITRVDAVAIGDLRERYTAPQLSLCIIMIVKYDITRWRISGLFHAGFFAYAWL